MPMATYLYMGWGLHFVMAGEPDDAVLSVEQSELAEVNTRDSDQFHRRPGQAELQPQELVDAILEVWVNVYAQEFVMDYFAAH